MSVSADHTLDLGFVNYVQHPENSNYSVFRFYDDNRAASFELALTEQKIWFEKAEEERKKTEIPIKKTPREEWEEHIQIPPT